MALDMISEIQPFHEWNEGLESTNFSIKIKRLPVQHFRLLLLKPALNLQ